MNYMLKGVFIALSTAMIMAPTGLLAVPKTQDTPVPEAGEPTFNAKTDRVSQNRYYTMKPFTMPLLRNGRVVEHFTLVISMELAEEDARVGLVRRIPRIRDNMYRTLFQMITFRRRGAPLPDVDMFKKRLRKIAVRVAGKDLVSDVLVQQAFKQTVH